jgi:hypothetical protein
MNNDNDDLEFNNIDNNNNNNNNYNNNNNNNNKDNKQKLHKQQSIRFEPATGSYRRITQIMSKNKLIRGLSKKSSSLLDINNLNDDNDNDGMKDNERSTFETYRIKMNYALYNTSIGIFYNQLVLTLSTVSCFQFIYLTYTQSDNDPTNKDYTLFKNLELTIAIILLFDWLIHFIVADNKTTYVTSFYSMIDLLTVIPIFSTSDIVCPSKSVLHHSASTYIAFVLCGINTTRILRALKFRQLFEYIDDEVYRAIANMGLKITLMILFSSAVMVI